MNRLEFNEVLKTIDVSNSLNQAIGKYGSHESIYYWKDLAIWYSGGASVMIKGGIPFEVAKVIDYCYQKPHNPYGITTVESEMNMFFNDFSDDDYVKSVYEVYNREGLLIIFAALKDYYSKKNKEPEMEMIKYDRLLGEVTQGIINKINPSVSAYDWMSSSPDIKTDYENIIIRDNQTTAGKKFREALMDFDKAVNPFIDIEVEFSDAFDYIKNVRINGNTGDELYGKHKKNSCWLEIVDKQTGNKAYYQRDPEGFEFMITYQLDNNQYLKVSHHYSNSGEYFNGKGESLNIQTYLYDKFDFNYSCQDIYFNITNGTIGTTYGTKNIATPEQIKKIYYELLKSIDYAKEITINNMQKQNKKHK